MRRVVKGEGAIQPAHSNVSFPTLPPVIPDYCQSSYPRAVSVIGFYSPDSCPVNICGSELGCVDMSWRRFFAKCDRPSQLPDFQPGRVRS